MLCNERKREGAQASPDLVSGLCCSVPLHNIRYGIQILATQSLSGYYVWNLSTGHLLGTLPLGNPFQG